MKTQNYVVHSFKFHCHSGDEGGGIPYYNRLTLFFLEGRLMSGRFLRRASFGMTMGLAGGAISEKSD